MALLESFFSGLDYYPNDQALLLRALTHRSFSSDHNERLEFLGDAIIDLVIAEILYYKFTDKPEGELSRYRAELVCASMLANIAREIRLNEVIRLGEGERKSGGADRESILSGALEALAGAIYLDSGIHDCKRIILAIFAARIDNIESHARRKDPKTALQELMQANRMPLPKYKLVNTAGSHHDRMFRMACQLEAFGKTIEAEAVSKKQAERIAAEQMLEWLNKERKL